MYINILIMYIYLFIYLFIKTIWKCYLCINIKKYIYYFLYLNYKNILIKNIYLFIKTAKQIFISASNYQYKAHMIDGIELNRIDLSSKDTFNALIRWKLYKCIWMKSLFRVYIALNAQ